MNTLKTRPKAGKNLAVVAALVSSALIGLATPIAKAATATNSPTGSTNRPAASASIGVTPTNRPSPASQSATPSTNDAVVVTNYLAILTNLTTEITPPTETNEGWSISALWHDRLEIGFRVPSYKLNTTTAADPLTFIGSVNELELQKDEGYSLPKNLVVSYKILPYVGVNYIWDGIRVSANSHYSSEDFSTDGDFVLEGPVYSVFIRIPNPTGIVPYAGIGRIHYSARFEPAGYWANGYDNEDYYRVFGPEPLNNKTRRMFIEDANGKNYHFGVAVHIWKGLNLDFRYEYSKVETDVRFEGRVKDDILYTGGPSTVPFTHSSTSFGLTYAF